MATGPGNFPLLFILLLISATTCVYGGAIPFHLPVSQYTLYEDEGQVSIEVVRNGPAELEESARLEWDLWHSSYSYHIFYTNVIFPPGATNRHVQLSFEQRPPVEDRFIDVRLYQGEKIIDTALVTLKEAKTAIGAFGEPVSVLHYQYGVVAGMVPITASEGSVAEVLFRRTGRPTGRLVADYTPVDVTARNGVDYILEPGSIVFEDGQSTSRLVVPLPENSRRELPLNFAILLSSSTNYLQVNNGVQFTILDNDHTNAPGTLSDAPLGTVLTHPVTQVITAADGTLILASEDRDLGPLVRIDTEGRRLVIRRDSFYGALWPDASGVLYLTNGMYIWDEGVIRVRLRRALPFGRSDTSFTALLDGSVHHVLPLPDKKVFVTGVFTNVNSTLRPLVALLLPDGSLDPLFRPTASLSGVPRGSCLMEDGSFLVGGLSASQGEKTASGGVRIWPDGRVDFQKSLPLWGKPSLLQDGRTLAVDSSLSAWMPDGARDLTFGVGTNWNGRVLAELPDGRLLLRTSSGQLLRLFADGSHDPSFLWQINGSVETALPLPDGRLAVGGAFTSVGGSNANHFALLHLYDSYTPRLLWNAFRKSVSEDSIAECVVLRDGDASFPITVSYQTFPATALHGLDFVESSGTITFLPGERQKSIRVRTLRNMSPSETDRTFSVSLACTNSLLLGVCTNLSVTIIDRELFAGAATGPIKVSEGVRSIAVPLRRYSGAGYIGNMRWQVEPVPPGSDVTNFAVDLGAIFWNAGTKEQTVLLTLQDDADITGPRNYTLRLYADTDGMVITNGDILITLLDNDAPGFTGDGFNGEINSLQSLASGHVLATGDFTRCAGAPFNGIVALDSRTGRPVPGFSAGGNWGRVISAIPAPDGGFAALVQYGGVSALERFDALGNKIPNFAYDPPPNRVQTPAGAFSPQGQLYLLGRFFDYNGSFRDASNNTRGLGALARYGSDGKRDTNFVTTITGSGDIFFEPNGDFWLGGSFLVSRQAPRSMENSSETVVKYFARFTPEGLPRTNVLASFSNAIFSMARAQDGSFFAWGAKPTTVDNQPVKKIVRLTKEGRLDPSFVISDEINELLAYPGLTTMHPLDHGKLLLVTTSSFQGASMRLLDQSGSVVRQFGTHSLDPWKPGYWTDNYPVLVPQSGSVIFVGGDVRWIDGRPVGWLSRLYMDGVIGTDGPFALLGAKQEADDFLLDLEIRDEARYEIERTAEFDNWLPGDHAILHPGRQTVRFKSTDAKSYFRLRRSAL